MISKRLGGIGAALGLALGLGACVDDYGYGGMQVGYGYGGYGDPYYDGGYGDYGYGGYGYGPSYFGWYGDYYYPGTGIYVYDQYRRPYRWNDAQRRYWSGQQRYRGRDGNGGPRWNGFDRNNRPGQFDGNPGNRQWQGRNGVAPGSPGYRGPDGQRYRGTPGARTWDNGNRTFNAPARTDNAGAAAQRFNPPPRAERSMGAQPRGGNAMRSGGFRGRRPD